jgi:hypothetical protein
MFLTSRGMLDDERDGCEQELALVAMFFNFLTEVQLNQDMHANF